MDTLATRTPEATDRNGFGSAARAAGSQSGAADDASFLEPLERTLASLRRMASNYAHLAILDAQRAGIQLAWLIAAGILIAVLVVTAWLACVIALAVALLGQGLSWPAVLIVAAVLNLLGAGLVVWRVRGIFDRRPFDATLSQLREPPPHAAKVGAAPKAAS
jgi:uncharacterized membrane protein YqjE